MLTNPPAWLLSEQQVSVSVSLKYAALCKNIKSRTSFKYLKVVYSDHPAAEGEDRQSCNL